MPQKSPDKPPNEHNKPQMKPKQPPKQPLKLMLKKPVLGQDPATTLLHPELVIEHVSIQIGPPPKMTWRQ